MFGIRVRLLLVLAVLAVGGVVVARYFNTTYSANIVDVSVTTSNSRLSFRGALAAGNVEGTSTVIIDSTPNNQANSFPSSSSAQIVEGDTVLIGNGGTMNVYTVASSSAMGPNSFLDRMQLTTSLLSGNADVGDDIVSTQAATLYVRFETVSAIQDGKFRVLIPAGDGGTASQDGIPDGGHFDYGTTTPTVTCPNDIANYTFGAGTPTPNLLSINGIYYHAYDCGYTGTGAVNTAFDGGANGMITINQVINPAPKAGHTSGVADAHTIILQHLDTGDNAVDTTPIRIAFIEAVKVTAYVAPQITFKIIGVDAGTSLCGVATDVTTTATNVPFEEIGIGTFTSAAQGLSVSTNAVGGYVVTAAENDQLGRNGATCTGDPTAPEGSPNFNPSCIQDTRGDNALATHDTSDEWNNPGAIDGSGFGYSLDDVNGTTTEAFTYNESARTFSARQFADLQDSQLPVLIFSDNQVAANDNLYVCYRIMPDVVTAAGNYENYITYTATATF